MALTLSARAQAAAAGCLYLTLALMLTWPMPANLGSQVFGGGGDTWADIAVWREFAERNQLPFFSGVVGDFGAPEGWHYGTAIYLATWSSTVIKWSLFFVAGPVVGWNIWVLAGYVATGTGTFLLARKLTGSARAALIGGFAYAFWPWAVENGKAHVEFSHGWVFVLLAWRMLELRDRPTIRNGVLAGGAAIVCVSYNPYYLLFGAVVYAVFALAGLAAARRGRLAAAIKAQAVSAGLLLAAVATYAVANAASAAEGTRTYGIEQLVTYGARPLQYLVPHPDTIVLGSRTASWWETHTQGAGLNEKSLYLGITVLLLATIAFVAVLVRRAAPGQKANTWTFALLALVAAGFSAPPYFQPGGGVTLYMPSYFVYAVLPTWRVFSRFGEVVMFAVAMLAAIGLARLLRSRPPRQAAAIFAAAAVLVPLDLWARPSVPTSAIPHPPVYAFLEGEREGILAEYPLAPNSLPEYTWALTQDDHDMPLLNGYTSGSREESRALWLFELGEPETAAELALLGVTHVVLWENYVPPRVRVPRTPDRGFRLLGRADGKSLWRVEAEPAAGMAWLAQGGGESVEGEIGGHYMWLEQPTGEIDVLGDCDRCRGVLRFRALSHVRPRRLRIADASGRTLVDETVRPGRTRRFAIPVSFRRSLRLGVEVTPGPEPAGGGDVRKVSVAIIEPRYHADG